MTHVLAAKIKAESLGLALEAPDIDYLESTPFPGSGEDLLAIAHVLLQNKARDLVYQASTQAGSPLEAALWMAIRHYCDRTFGGDEYCAIRKSQPWLWHYCPHGHSGPHRDIHDGFSSVGLCSQHKFGRYHLDFLLTAYDGPNQTGQIAIEVDGHDFHERTKEQARRDRSRDRAIQEAGMKVFRFTGSEVYAGPLACAKQAVDAAFGRDMSKSRQYGADDEVEL